jgi:hypothetical protein
MKVNMEIQLAWSEAARLGVRREAKRHAAFVRAGRVECSRRFVRAKAVSPLRSATAVQDTGVMKKLIEIRGHLMK